MLGVFDPEQSYNNSTLLQKLETEAKAGLPVDKSVEKFATNLNKMALETSLNLSEYPAHKLLNLPEHRVFNNFARFCHTVADTTNEP